MKDFLKNMKSKMPSPASDPEADMMLDAETVDMGEESAPEAGAPGPLADASDKDLLAEVKKRGLSLEDETGAADMQEDSMEMDLEEA